MGAIENRPRNGNTPAYAGKTIAMVKLLESSKKHPRLRGEDHEWRVSGYATKETPPLTRGRLLPDGRVVARRGNTPAYAGKTRPLLSLWLSRQKHPRLRGEDCVSKSKSFQPRETPPLTRGRRGVVFGHLLQSRNTPAYAGKTPRVASSSSSCRNTPAYAGKTGTGLVGFSKLEETPPLTRGRRRTKAVAGALPLKHPRLRGEDGPKEA